MFETFSKYRVNTFRGFTNEGSVISICFGLIKRGFNHLHPGIDRAHQDDKDGEKRCHGKHDHKAENDCPPPQRFLRIG